MVHGNPLSEFDYGAVTLSPGAHSAQMSTCRDVLMNLDNDSLLRPFRQVAGLPDPGRDLGGWYSAPRFLSETFGQWISALSRFYAATQDVQIRQKIESLLKGYATTMEPTGRLFAANGNPLYLHDKLVMGLTDSSLALGHDFARTMLTKFADCSREIFLQKHSAHHKWALPDGHLSGYCYAGTYLRAWQLGGGDQYLKLAQQDLSDDFFSFLARGENVLSNRHAYSHVNALGNALQGYLILGDERLLRAAINGFSYVEQQSFSTGGYGPGEMFLPKPAWNSGDSNGRGSPADQIETVADSLRREHAHFETGCGSYAHFNLTRALLRITKNPRYGDSMERVMYNAALGALPMNPLGKAFYHSNYGKYARKSYFDGWGNLIEDEWPCCSGTLPQLSADYLRSIYFSDREALYVNLYVPSTVRWAMRGNPVSVTQASTYPLANSVEFAISTMQPSSFTLKFRIPQWATAAELRLNDKRVEAGAVPGVFASVHRRWHDGDRITLTLGMTNELVASDGRHPELTSLRYGPMVLFAIGVDLPKLTTEMLLSARQSLPGGVDWKSGSVQFLPWWIIRNETYTTYFEVG